MVLFHSVVFLGQLNYAKDLNNTLINSTHVNLSEHYQQNFSAGLSKIYRFFFLGGRGDKLWYIGYSCIHVYKFQGGSGKVIGGGGRGHIPYHC